MSSCQTFVTFLSLRYLLTLCCFINFCRLIKLSLSYDHFVIYSLFTLSTYLLYTPKPQLSLPSHRVRTLSAPILHLFNSTGVFGHLAILIWGDRGLAEGFLLEQTLKWIALGEQTQEGLQLLWSISASRKTSKNFFVCFTTTRSGCPFKKEVIVNSWIYLFLAIYTEIDLIFVWPLLYLIMGLMWCNLVDFCSL